MKHTVPLARESLVFVMMVAARMPLAGLDALPPIFPLLLFLYLCIMVNLLLFCFNLLPMPFLDGGKVLVQLSALQRGQSIRAVQHVLRDLPSSSSAGCWSALCMARC